MRRLPRNQAALLLQPLPVAASSTRLSPAASVGAVGATGRRDSILASHTRPPPPSLPRHLGRPHEGSPLLLLSPAARCASQSSTASSCARAARRSSPIPRLWSPAPKPNQTPYRSTEGIGLPQGLRPFAECAYVRSGLAPRRPVGAGCFFSWHVCVTAALSGVVWL